MQTKKQSMIEIATNVGVKFTTATLLWLLIKPWAMDMPAVCVTLVFTCNSFIFGYAIRRMFNRGATQ